jgi:hypothetical protein
LGWLAFLIRKEVGVSRIIAAWMFPDFAEGVSAALRAGAKAAFDVSDHFGSDDFIAGLAMVFKRPLDFGLVQHAQDLDAGNVTRRRAGARADEVWNGEKNRKPNQHRQGKIFEPTEAETPLFGGAHALILYVYLNNGEGELLRRVTAAPRVYVRPLRKRRPAEEPEPGRRRSCLFGKNGRLSTKLSLNDAFVRRL